MEDKKQALSDAQLHAIRTEAATIADDWAERQPYTPDAEECNAKFVREVLRLCEVAAPATAPSDAAVSDERAAVQSDISADSHFIAGMKLGWNLCDAGDEKGFHACIEGRRKQIRDARALAQTAPVGEAKPKLSVWYGPMPESNGKTNWTAILHKGDIASGMTIDKSEYPDRVRYEADRVRWLIGELDKEPFILDYDADKHSGYVAPTAERAALTDGQREAIEWAAGRAHVEALGKPIDGPEGKRWRTLSDMFRFSTAAQPEGQSS
jgi:hypothetical protein